MTHKWIVSIAVVAVAMVGCSKQEVPQNVSPAAPAAPAEQPAVTHEEEGHSHSGMSHEAMPAPEGASTDAASSERNAKCPVTGENIPAGASFVEKDGLRVYFCCAGCRKKIEGDFEKYYKIAYGK